MSFFGGRRNQQPEPTPEPHQDRASSLYNAPSPTNPTRETRETPIPPAQPVGFETVLGASCTLDGTLVSTGNVRLDGTFNGSLDIHGNVLVGETAKIEADITAKNISIAGAVRGNVTGKKVQLLRTGRVWGDITAIALSTEEGAFIDGKISMVSKEDPRPVTEPTRPQDARIDEPAAEPDFLAATDEVSAVDSAIDSAEMSAAPGQDWPDDGGTIYGEVDADDDDLDDGKPIEPI
jgi:cytoskeletal protein CcmA (bactofilin family)